MRVDLGVLIRCYNPRPGYLGETAMLLPAPVWHRAEELAGVTLTLREAVHVIQQVTPGIVRPREGRILLFLTLGSYENCWRVLRYREVRAEDRKPWLF